MRIGQRRQLPILGIHTLNSAMAPALCRFTSSAQPSCRLGLTLLTCGISAADTSPHRVFLPSTVARNVGAGSKFLCPELVG